MKISNLENIELEITNKNSKKISFGDEINLRSKKIKYIDVPSSKNVPITPTGRATVNDNVYSKSFLVLNIDSEEKINRIPLISLNPYANNGRRIELADLVVNWPKSYIEIGSTESVEKGEAFFLNIFF